MFEVLSRWEATALMAALSNGYEDSRQFATELNGWKSASRDAAMIGSYNADLNAQAAMRSELTALRWQVKREALDKPVPDTYIKYAASWASPAMRFGVQS